MIELRLHGALGRDFGTTWKFEVRTVREAINAISAQVKGFRAAVMALDRTGLAFRVRTKTEDLGESQLLMNLGESCRVDIIPIMRGASATARLIVGAVLIVAGIVANMTGVGAAAAPYLISTGIGLVIGSIAEMLAPTAKREEYKDDIKSWMINGPLNTTDQGNPVPVIYGEVLTGGVPISAGLTTVVGLPVTVQTPVATVGGDINDVFRFGGPVSGGQVVLYYSVSTQYLLEPFTYQWTVTGFPAANRTTVTGLTAASIQVTLSYDIPIETTITDVGNVHVTVRGYKTDGSGTALTPGGTATPSIVLDTRVPDWN